MLSPPSACKSIWSKMEEKVTRQKKSAKSFGRCWQHQSRVCDIRLCLAVPSGASSKCCCPSESWTISSRGIWVSRN